MAIQEVDLNGAGALELDADGSRQLGSFEFTWTEDVNGSRWHTALFDSLDEARAYACEVVAANEGNGTFGWFARRAVQVFSPDFLSDRSATEMRVISNVTVPDTGCVRVDGFEPETAQERVYAREAMACTR